MITAPATGLEGRAGFGGALRDYWHPVAAASEVGPAPVAVRLLDTPIALWRAGGQVVAFYDLCIHRGTPLSMGWLDGERLVCAYHGWQYDGSGACVRIPSLAPERGIPAKARAISFPTEERYGLVWVCLGAPQAGIPEFPAALADSTYRWTQRAVEIHANAARFMENGMDQSHFAFVHAGVIAVDPEVAAIELRETPDGFAWDVENPLNTLKPDGPQERTTYRVTLPFTLAIEKYAPGGDERRWLIFVGSPVTSKRTTVFRFLGINFRRFTDEEEQRRQQRIFEQDRAVVEAQRPEELPLDLREELHLRGPDAAALVYRKALARLGVDWG